MKQSAMTANQRAYAEQQVNRNMGCWYDLLLYSWVQEPQEDGSTKEVKVAAPVTYYIGEMNADQLVPVLSLLGSFFAGAATGTTSEQPATATSHITGPLDDGVLTLVTSTPAAPEAANAGFDVSKILSKLSGDDVKRLYAAVLEEPLTWVDQPGHFSTVNLFKVLGKFFKYNPFFELVAAGAEFLSEALATQ